MAYVEAVQHSWTRLLRKCCMPSCLAYVAATESVVQAIDTKLITEPHLICGAYLDTMKHPCDP